jgi:hypothetical protein
MCVDRYDVFSLVGSSSKKQKVVHLREGKPTNTNRTHPHMKYITRVRRQYTTTTQHFNTNTQENECVPNEQH